MIVWLASYPRSGSHLLRTILQRCFGLGSYEIYQEIARSPDATVATVIGAKRFDDKDVDSFLARARRSPELFLIKTHGPVPDSEKCVYVVRDGRAALVSYQRYLAEVEHKRASIPELIAGKHWPGKWTAHVRRFLARSPTNTLILRYEELASETPPLDAIGHFLDARAQQPFDIQFSYLNELDPLVFPTGNNDAGIEAVERDHCWLFWRRCGETMRVLGYVPPTGQGPGERIGAFLSHPARYAGAVVWPAIRSRFRPMQTRSE